MTIGQNVRLEYGVNRMVGDIKLLRTIPFDLTKQEIADMENGKYIVRKSDRIKKKQEHEQGGSSGS